MLLLTGASATGAPNYRVLTFFFFAGALIYICVKIFLGGWEILVLGAAGFLAFGSIGALLGLWIGYSIFMVRKFNPWKLLKDENGQVSLLEIFERGNMFLPIKYVAATAIFLFGLPGSLSLLDDWNWVSLHRLLTVTQALRPYWPILDRLGTDQAPSLLQNADTILLISATMIVIYLIATFTLYFRNIREFLVLYYLTGRKKLLDGASSAALWILTPIMFALSLFFLWGFYKTGLYFPKEKAGAILWGMFLFIAFFTGVTLPGCIGTILWSRIRYGDHSSLFWDDIDLIWRKWRLPAVAQTERDTLSQKLGIPLSMPGPTDPYIKLPPKLFRSGLKPRYFWLVALSILCAPFLTSLIPSAANFIPPAFVGCCLCFALGRAIHARIWEALAGMIIGFVWFGPLGAVIGGWSGYAAGECRRYSPITMIVASMPKPGIRFDLNLLWLPLLTCLLLGFLPEALFTLLKAGILDLGRLYPVADALSFFRPIAYLEAYPRYAPDLLKDHQSLPQLAPVVFLICFWLFLFTIAVIFAAAICQRRLYAMIYAGLKLPLFDYSLWRLATIFYFAALIGIWAIGLAEGFDVVADDETFTRWGGYWAFALIFFLLPVMEYIAGRAAAYYKNKPDAFQQALSETIALAKGTGRHEDGDQAKGEAQSI